MLKTISSSLTISRKTGRNVGKPSRGRVNLPDGEVNSGKRNRGTGEIPCVSIVPGVNQIVAFNPNSFGNKVLIASSFGESGPNPTQTDVKSGSLGINFEFLKNGGGMNLDGSFELAKNCTPSPRGLKQIESQNLPYQKGEVPFEPRLSKSGEIMFDRNRGVYIDIYDNVWGKGPGHNPKLRADGISKEWDVQLSYGGKQRILNNSNIPEEIKMRIRKGKTHINITFDGEIAHQIQKNMYFITLYPINKFQEIDTFPPESKRKLIDEFIKFFRLNFQQRKELENNNNLILNDDFVNNIILNQDFFNVTNWKINQSFILNEGDLIQDLDLNLDICFQNKFLEMEIIIFHTIKYTKSLKVNDIETLNFNSDIFFNNSILVRNTNLNVFKHCLEISLTNGPSIDSLVLSIV